jgi:chemotaxis protein MotB
MKSIKIFSYLFFSAILITGCVSERKYSELKAQYDECITKRDRYQTGFNEVEVKLKTEQENSDRLRSDIASLRLDSIECQLQLERTKKAYHDLQEVQQRIITNSRDEQDRTRRELLETSELLKNRERDVMEKESKLRDNETRIRKLQEDLAKREERVYELEKILRSKDSTVMALKENMQRALFNFQNSGLTVEVKNGKVYVSMDEKLLFKSGSIDVDSRGRTALLELAKALQNQQDVSIMVEGHTDNVPMRSATIKDNWDLSVLRATSIVRILTVEGNLNPTRVIASGRGEFVPIDSQNTPDARAKNRRTEIILTPKLDELLEILGNR